MSNPDPGTATDGVTLPATWFNTVRTGVLNALDIAGGSRTITSKLTLLGTAMFELGDQLLYTSATAARWQPPTLGFIDLGVWNFTTEGWLETIAATAGDALVPIHDLPHGNVLDSVTARVKGGPGHGGTLPTNMPLIKVWRKTISSGATTQIGSTATDASASAAAYEGWHDITAGSLAHTIDRTLYTYYLQITSESAGSAVDEFEFSALSTSCTITKQPRGY